VDATWCSSCAEDVIGIRPSAIRPARLMAAGDVPASSTGPSDAECRYAIILARVERP
jgi:hypothetical protein